MFKLKRMIIVLSAALILLSPLPTVTAVDYPVYDVKAGDTLWRISELYKVSLTELKRINGLHSDTIQIGQELKIPVSNDAPPSASIVKPSTKVTNAGKYTVKQGDTLSFIARKYGVSVEQIKASNGLRSDFLQIGDVLVIGSEERVALSNRGTTVRTASFSTNTVSYTNKDADWLAKIIEAEAEDEPYEGKLAVGSVVLNRVKSDNFPDSITEVIFQRTSKVYQFSPVANGRIYRVKPSKDSLKAATAALKGEDPTDGALYFYNPTISKDKWIRGREVVTVIGRHRFAL